MFDAFAENERILFLFLVTMDATACFDPISRRRCSFDYRALL